MKCVAATRPDGSPGLPYSQWFVNNKQITHVRDDVLSKDFVDECVERINKFYNEDVSTMDRTEMILKDVVDPMSGFVKMEPHPLRKKGKERIVCCCSIRDQVVSRYFMTSLINAAKSLYPLAREVIGIGFTEAMATEFAEAVMAMLNGNDEPLKLVLSDIGGWDSSVIQSLVNYVYERALVTMDDPASFTRFRKAFKNYAHSVLNTTYAVVVSPGKFILCHAADGGFWCSGRFETSYANSIMRVKTMIMTGAVDGKAVGDDGTEARPGSQTLSYIKEQYATLGLNARDCEIMDKDTKYFSTCSHTFYKRENGTWHCTLDSWPKALFRLLTRKGNPDLLAAFSYELGEHPDRMRIMDAAERFITLAPTPYPFVPQCAGPISYRQTIPNLITFHKMAPNKNKPPVTPTKGRARKNRMQTERKPSNIVSALPRPVPPTNDFVRVVHGHCNPWSNDALGQKVHDTCNVNTVAIRSVTRFGIIIPASTAAIVSGAVLNPNFNAGSKRYTTPADQTSAWTFESTQTDGSYTGIAAIGYSYRLVSWGVRLFCTAAYNAAEGHVILATTRYVGAAPTNAEMQNANGYLDYQIIALRDLDHMWTSHIVDQEDAREFQTMSHGADTGFTSLIVQWAPGGTLGGTTAAYGALTPTFQIEVVKNFEIIPLVNTIGHTLATPSKPTSTTIHAAVESVHSSMGHIHPRETHGDVIKNKIKDVATKLFTTGLDVFAPRASNMLKFLTTPQRPMIMDVD